MKFSFKIVIGTMLIVVIMFTISGIILIHNNFKNSYNLLINNNIEEHFLEKSAIESNINENITTDGFINRKSLENYLYTLTSYLENSRKVMIYIDDEKLWNNLPFEIDKNTLNEVLTIKTYENTKYSILCSTTKINNENVLIVSAYDISGVFKVRDQNLLCFYIIDVILLALCGCLTTLFAKFLTKPIKTLNEGAKEVTKGNLDIKIEQNTDDEIGELANSFNIMIDSIKSNIDELKLSVRRKEDFVSNFTHELKTPMTSIMGYAKILKQDKYTKEDKEKALNYIYSESKRLEILSHKMLDLLELSAGQIELSTINTKKYFKKFEELATSRLNPIHLKLYIENCNILGDADLLTTCFMNLVENSKKASDETSEIKIVGKKKNGKYKISIIDKGIGIEDSELSRITESFYMVDRSRNKKKGGYGIGLSLCERIASLHNTNLKFESIVGKGTTVSLELEMIEYDTK